MKGVFPYQSTEEIEGQIGYLETLEMQPDLLVPNEVNQYRRKYIREMLKDRVGYEGIGDTLSWANELRNSDIQPHHDIGHTNGNLTAVRDPDALEHKPWSCSTHRTATRISSTFRLTTPKKSSSRPACSGILKKRYGICVPYRGV